MRERNIESYLLRQARAREVLCLKFVSPGVSGVPDRVLIHRGRIHFVELKRPCGGTLSPLQRYMHTKLRRYGASVDVVYTRNQVDEVLAGLTVETTPDLLTTR